MTLGAGCRDDEPRKDEISTMLEALWASVPVDPAQVTVGEYVYYDRDGSTFCSSLPREDRWIAARAALLPGEVIDQERLEASIAEFLEAEGFAVERYRSTHPATPTRAIRAERGEMVVHGILGGNGNANVGVRSGPCAALSPTFDMELYELDS